MVILLIAVYLAAGSRFRRAYDQSNLSSDITRDVIIVLVWAALFVLFMILMIKKNYYEISKTTLVHKRFVGEVSYDFNNVVYIDEAYSIKHNTLLFYNNKGKELYLVMDKNQELLKVFKQNCHNLKSKEEVFSKKDIKL